MKFEVLAKGRRSAKEFLADKEVDWRDVVDAIDCANNIPLAGNISVLKFLMVEDEEKISKIASASQQDFINNSSIAVIVCSNKEQLVRNFGKVDGERFAHQEAGAAIQNFLLKIADLGLGACWIGHFSEKIIRRLFKVDKAWDIEALIVVGREAKKTLGEERGIVKPRIEDTVFFEEWDEKKRKK